MLLINSTWFFNLIKEILQKNANEMKFLIMAIGHCSLDTQACDCHYTWAASCLRSLVNSHEKKKLERKVVTLLINLLYEAAVLQVNNKRRGRVEI